MDYNWSYYEFLEWSRKCRKTTPKEYGIMLSNRKRRGGGKKRKGR